VVKSTLHADVLDVMGSRIVAGDYAPGAMLRTDDLEAEFDVSRTVVREILKVLESMRMIAVRRAVGITVLDPRRWNVFDPRVIRWRLSGEGRSDQLRSLTDLRFAIEPVAAGAAATKSARGVGEELVRLAELMETTGARGDLDQFLLHDIAYHRLLLEASGNDMFASLGDVVAEVLTGRTAHHLMPDHPKSVARRLHKLVAESVQNGDSRTAESAMRELLSEVEQQLTTL
jgi:DNA-binding FadR family transcriptional regulator